jgi:subtilisin-like proprotein convertase family protein
MDIRSPKLCAVSAFIITAGIAFPAFATHIHTYGGSFNLPIPDRSWMADAVIDVPDHLVISDIDVGISIKHSSVFDLQIFLQSPLGANRRLNMYNTDEFFKGADYIQTIFDDEAQVPIEQAEPPFTGRFRPRAGGSLDVFDGGDAFGTWRLRIYDAFDADTGTLENFELIITTPAPEPATATLLVVGTWLATLLKPKMPTAK